MKEERPFFTGEKGPDEGCSTQGRVSVHWNVTESMGGYIRLQHIYTHKTYGYE